jgi:hypothetical protein
MSVQGGCDVTSFNWTYTTDYAGTLTVANRTQQLPASDSATNSSGGRHHHQGISDAAPSHGSASNGVAASLSSSAAIDIDAPETSLDNGRLRVEAVPQLPMGRLRKKGAILFYQAVTL